MADKKYRMRLALSDGLAWFLDFIAPQGPKGDRGDDGVSPEVTVEDIAGGHKVTITDASGEKSAIVLDGKDGVGVVAIEQTTTSDEDGGSNVITATLSDGTKSTFTVKNGSKGSKGDAGNGIKGAVLNGDYTLTLTFDDGTTYTTPSIRGAVGDPGKNAYAYAQEAGYTGTEEEWANMIASGGVHIGDEAPSDENIRVWVDTSEKAAELEGAAAVGKIFMVTAVDENGNPTKYKWVDLPKGETPDWNANEGEAGHILNRTHYVDEKGIVHKLPNMFIDAEWMATKEDGGAGKTVFIPEQTVSSGLWKNLQADLVEGAVYAVEVNGVLYRCVCHDDGDGTLYLGNGSLLGDTTTAHNNEPFCIGWLTGTGGAFYTDGTLEAPIGIKVTNWLDVVYNKLPEEYLPENVVKGEGGKVSWDNVSDKPFSQDAGELLFSHTATFATDAGVEKVTGVTLSLVEGAEYWLDVNGEMIKCRCENVSTATYALYDSADNMWLKKVATFLFVYGQAAGTYTYNLYGLSEDIVLDPQYIPKNIARISDIPDAVVNPSSASVGQTIIVEEVDESGKPTKWKSADYQPRTHYEAEGEILPETTISTQAENILGGVKLEIGKTYKVFFDGVEYKCTAIDGSMAAEEGSVLLGNGGALGMEDTGEPFAIVYMPAYDGTLAIVVTELESETATLKIWGDAVTPIPIKFIPDIVTPFVIKVVEAEYSSGVVEYESFTTQSELKANIDSGRQIMARVNFLDGCVAQYAFTCATADASEALFLGYSTKGLLLSLVASDGYYSISFGS